jgi:xanthine dehydrogenase accessory factor
VNASSKIGPLSAVSAAELLLDKLTRGARAALITVLEGPEATVGRRVLLTTRSPEPELAGSLGSAEIDARLVALGTRALAGAVTEGAHVLGGEPELRVYVELHAPPPEFVIVGAGHIAQPLSTLGRLLGLRVTVLDARPEFATTERFPDAAVVRSVDFTDPFRDVPIHGGTHVVLVTRGHKYDFEALRKLLASTHEPAYIGMIGSRRRVRATFAQLVKEGFDHERLGRVRAPVGLDLRSETPAEIAVSVAAEIVLVRRGGTGVPIAEQERIMDRFFKKEEES